MTFHFDIGSYSSLSHTHTHMHTHSHTNAHTHAYKVSFLPALPSMKVWWWSQLDGFESRPGTVSGTGTRNFSSEGFPDMVQPRIGLRFTSSTSRSESFRSFQTKRNFDFAAINKIHLPQIFLGHLSSLAWGLFAPKRRFFDPPRKNCHTAKPLVTRGLKSNCSHSRRKLQKRCTTTSSFKIQIRATLSPWQLKQDTPASTTRLRQFDAVEKNSAKKWIFESDRISLDGATNGRRRRRRRLRTFGQTNCCLNSLQHKNFHKNLSQLLRWFQQKTDQL